MTATAIPLRETCECPKCSGTGTLPEFSHIADGTCFMCSGTGTFSYKTFIGPGKELRLDVFKRNGEFWYAQFRCITWKPYTLTRDDGTVIEGREGGKDLFYHEVRDADEARKLWREAGAVNNVWED